MDGIDADLGRTIAPARGWLVNFSELASVATRQASAFARTAEERDLIAQEGLSRAWERQHTFDPARGTAEAWLFGIIRNVAREQRRDERTQESLWSRLRGTNGNEASDERLEVVEAMLRLPDADQELLYLRFWEGRRHRDIAHQLGITEATCRQRLRRAIVELGRTLR